MDYRQTTGSAQSWRRARQVQILNQRGVTPSISFSEEDVVSFSGMEVLTPVLSVVRGTFDPNGAIPLVNPDTGELTGASATQAELYVIVYSLYLQLARQRDAAAADLASQQAADIAARNSAAAAGGS
jgi:hypothetical protein